MKRVLLVRAGALGDVLLLRRAVFALAPRRIRVDLARARVRRARVLVGTRRIRGHGAASTGTGRTSRRCSTSALRLRRRCRASCDGFDARARLHPQRGVARAASAAIVPRVVARRSAAAAGSAGGALATRAAGGPGDRDDVDPPPLLPTDAGTSAARTRGVRACRPRFLAVHPGSGSPREELAGGALRRRGTRAVAGPCAGCSSTVRRTHDAAAALAPEPGAVRARELPPRVLGALLAQAGLYVGNDSGVSHLAAAFGAPTLALFGPTDPAQWAPVGAARRRPCSAPDGRMDAIWRSRRCSRPANRSTYRRADFHPADQAVDAHRHRPAAVARGLEALAPQRVHQRARAGGVAVEQRHRRTRCRRGPPPSRGRACPRPCPPAPRRGAPAAVARRVHRRTGEERVALGARRVGGGPVPGRPAGTYTWAAARAGRAPGARQHGQHAPAPPAAGWAGSADAPPTGGGTAAPGPGRGSPPRAGPAPARRSTRPAARAAAARTSAVQRRRERLRARGAGLAAREVLASTAALSRAASSPSR